MAAWAPWGSAWICGTGHSFIHGTDASADESHLVQDNEDVFTALVKQLAVEQCAVFGSVAALVEALFFRAFAQSDHLLP